MHPVIFFVYLFLLCLAVTRMRFFTSILRPRYAVLLFVLYAAAGCVHTWIAFHFYPGQGDIWIYFEQSIDMKKQLLAHPVPFITGIFSDGTAFNVTDASLPLLDIQYRLIQYINVLLDLFSFDNLYINTLLFSFPVFMGAVALFKVFYGVYRQPLTACCAVLVPSAIFWSPVVYKDGLLLAGTGYLLYFLLQPDKPRWRKGLLLLCAALLFVSRTNALVTFLPALLFYVLAEYTRAGKTRALLLTIASTVVAVIAFNALLHGGLFVRICDRQRDFQMLTGGSRIYLPQLAPTLHGFVAVLPVAMINGFFQPFPGTGGKGIYTLFSIELLLVWIIVLFACWLLIRKRIKWPGNFDVLCLLFAVPGLVLIGYMIPFAGAIIRYRSIYLPFLLAPFVHVICRYPLRRTQALNEWLYRHVLEVKKPVTG